MQTTYRAAVLGLLLLSGCGGGGGGNTDVVSVSVVFPASMPPGREDTSGSLTIEANPKRSPRYTGKVQVKIDTPAGIVVAPNQTDVELKTDGKATLHVAVTTLANAPSAASASRSRPRRTTTASRSSRRSIWR